MRQIAGAHGASAVPAGVQCLTLFMRHGARWQPGQAVRSPAWGVIPRQFLHRWRLWLQKALSASASVQTAIALMLCDPVKVPRAVPGSAPDTFTNFGCWTGRLWLSGSRPGISGQAGGKIPGEIPRLSARRCAWRPGQNDKFTGGVCVDRWCLLCGVQVPIDLASR